MPNQPSKQKRASQNRAQRAALQQRKAAAGAASGGGSASSSAGRGGGGRSLFGRLRGGGTGATASAVGRGAGGGAGPLGALTRADQPIGYRPALVGLLAAFASLLLCLVAIRVPVNEDGDLYTPVRLAAEWTTTAIDAAVAAPQATAEEVVDGIDEWTPDRSRELIAIAIWPLSLALALPIIGSYFGFRAVSRRRPGKIVNRAMFATLLGAFLTQGLFLLFLPSIIGLGVASFQIRKAELAAAQAAMAADAGPADGDVIDAEIVEDDAAGYDGGNPGSDELGGYAGGTTPSDWPEPNEPVTDAPESDDSGPSAPR